ncbi:MAG TPA: Xaa-Pro aminopeptidase [Thermoanaerobaculia bacterium]|nr:Xaa-Pro aminopeptidase [Thermoanaerobaculia bacterium]
MRQFLIFAILSAVSFQAFPFERQPDGDYRSRRERLAAKLGSGVAVVFASTEAEGQNATHGFRQNDDFFYLTGWREPGAALLIAPAAEARGEQAARPYTEILFLPAHNASQEKWTGPKLSAGDPDAAARAGVASVEALDRMRDALVRILPAPAATVLTELSETGSVPSTVPIEWLRRANAFPNYVTFRDIRPLIAELRVVKDTGEIARIRKATEATVTAHEAVMHAIKASMTENEISATLQFGFMRGGCEGPAYAPIVGSGQSSTTLHYSENSGTLRDGDLVVTDAAGEYSMYASDVTRTLPVSGRFTPRQREIYGIVLGAHDAAIAAFRSGVSTIGRSTPNSLYKIALEYLNTHGKDLRGQPLGPYMIHGLGHFVGLAVHDPGDTAEPLAPGMVFTIEPGIYLPEEHFGVRIEDDFLVGEDGKLICLSCALPMKAEDVEKELARR